MSTTTLPRWPVHDSPVIADHLQDQGWILHQDGSVEFDDGGTIEADGQVTPAHTNGSP